MEHSHINLFLLRLHLYFHLPKCLDFGNYDARAPEVVNKHSGPGGSENFTLLAGCLCLPSFLFLFIVLSMGFPLSSLKKHRDSGRCILNPHQEKIIIIDNNKNNNHNNISNNDNNNDNIYQIQSPSIDKSSSVKILSVLNYI